jgi:hypothetical protein
VIIPFVKTQKRPKEEKKILIRCEKRSTWIVRSRVESCAVVNKKPLNLTRGELSTAVSGLYAWRGNDG